MTSLRVGGDHGSRRGDRQSARGAKRVRLTPLLACPPSKHVDRERERLVSEPLADRRTILDGGCWYRCHVHIEGRGHGASSEAGAPPRCRWVGCHAGRDGGTRIAVGFGDWGHEAPSAAGEALRECRTANWRETGGSGPGASHSRRTRSCRTVSSTAPLGQTGKIWFLAGNFGGASQASPTRPCGPASIPGGKALFFPMSNALFWAPEDGKTVDEAPGSYV